MAFSINLGSLSISIGSDTTGFDKGIKKVKKGLKEGSKKLRASVNTWGKWGAAATAAAAAAAIAIFKSSASSIDSLAKTSDKLGIATEKLAALRFAAEQTGLTTQAMDKALLKMTQGLAEAAEGTGEAKDALEKLGLSADEMVNKSPDEALKAIADAMLNVEGQTKKVGIAFDIFGSRGTGLLNTIAGGSAALRDFEKQAERLGIALTRVDAKKVEEANDQLNIVSTLFKGIGQEATVQLSPIIAAMAAAFTDAASSAGDFGEAISDSIGFAVKVVGVFADGIRGIQVVFKGLEVIARGVISAITFAFEGLFKIVVGIGNTILEGWRLIFKKLADSLRPLSEAAANQLENVAKSIEGMKGKVPQIITDMSNAQLEALKLAKKEMHDLAMEEIPSAAFEKFVKKAQDTATKAAIKAANDIEKQRKGPSVSKDNTAKLELERIKKSNEQRISALTDRLDAERDLLDRARVNNLISREDHQRLMNEIDQKEADIRAKILSDSLALSNAVLPSISTLETTNTIIEETASTVVNNQVEGDTLGLPILPGQDITQSVGVTLGDVRESDRILEENTRILEALVEGNAMREETLLERLQRERDIINQAQNNELISRDEHARLMNDIDKREAQTKMSIITSTLDAAVQALSMGGKKASKMAKGLATVNAVIKGKEAAVAAWSAGMSVGGPWAPLVAASYTAASIARTAGMIRSINSGGKSIGGGGGSASIPSVPSGSRTPGGGQTPNQPSQSVTVNIVGQGAQLFTGDQIRSLMEQIDEQTDDGFTFAVTTGG